MGGAVVTVIEVEERATRSALERVEMIEAVAADLDAAEDGEHAAVLRGVVAMEWEAVAPVRVRIAASILGLSGRTVRAWVREGVLEAVVTEPRGLLDEVWRRVSDAHTLADPDLVESLAQMRRGETGVVLARADAGAGPAAGR